MKTFIPKTSEMKRDWLLVDAKGLVLGRLASRVANLLRGKGKPSFTPNMDSGDFVIVINAKHIELTGQKATDKLHFWHTGYPGGIHSETYGNLRANDPAAMLQLAVKRMLPRNKLRKVYLRKLKVYGEAQHPHAAQQPKAVKLAF